MPKCYYGLAKPPDFYIYALPEPTTFMRCRRCRRNTNHTITIDRIKNKRVLIFKCTQFGGRCKGKATFVEDIN